MRQALRTTALVALYAMLFSACRTAVPPVENIRDDGTGLFLAVTKSFGTSTYYVGSEGKWAYFKTNREDSFFRPTFRKVLASHMHLPRTFPLSQGKPYRIYLDNFVGYETTGH
jgi:hypothetical protein